ncbi:MAG: hypothetical protein J6U86_00645, partial [Clostridia bacterium]|nr:hypothetical protein [Clostridia bacterium]
HTEKGLSLYVDKIIKLPPLLSLPAPVASHPDMLVFVCGKKIFTYGQYLSENACIFEELIKLGYSVQCVCEAPANKYPKDIPLNCAVVGKNIIANKKYASASILSLASDEGLSILHTPQGYAKCSTVTVSENAIITADASIYKAAISAGIDALQITPEHVRLKGYGTGFIGGASGVLENAVLFCGDIKAHPDHDKIREFCNAHKKATVSLSSSPLYDLGTILIL